MLRSMLFDTASLRRIEAEQDAALGAGVLMQRAGAAIARSAAALRATRTGPVLVLAGPGNNGGDARVAAARLAASGFEVDVLESDAVPDDAMLAARLARAALVVDGLFGIGLSRPLSGDVARLVARVAACRRPVLSIDVPSGLDADSGAIVGGASAPCMRADVTLTLIGDKPGLHMGAGLECAGRVDVDAIGLEGLDAPGSLNAPETFAAAVRPRQRDGNKGSFGTCVLVGGSPGMAGAIMLAARAALLGGAGRTVAHRLGGGTDVDVLHPEVMWRAIERFEPASASAVVIGPGLGSDAAALALLRTAWHEARRLVIDADGLTLLSRHADFSADQRPHDGALVLTPHPLEAARLLELDAEAVNRDRLGSARRLADRYSAQVVLKGAGSVIAAPDDAHWFVNPTGNPGLASGGTGDILAGFIGALLGRPATPPGAALRAAVWIHGAAADDLVARGVGPIGLTASEITLAMRDRLNRLSSGAD